MNGNEWKDFLKINKRGVQNKVRVGVNIFQKLINGPARLFWTQEYARFLRPQTAEIEKWSIEKFGHF